MSPRAGDQGEERVSLLDYIDKSNKRRVLTAGFVINAQDTGSCCCLIRYRFAIMYDGSCKIDFCLSGFEKAVVPQLQMQTCKGSLYLNISNIHFSLEFNV